MVVSGRRESVNRRGHKEVESRNHYEKESTTISKTGLQLRQRKRRTSRQGCSICQGNRWWGGESLNRMETKEGESRGPGKRGITVISKIGLEIDQ